MFLRGGGGECRRVEIGRGGGGGGAGQEYRALERAGAEGVQLSDGR